LNPSRTVRHEWLHQYIIESLEEAQNDAIHWLWTKIATFTGHRLKDVGAILAAHYLSRDSRLAESGLKKRETHEAGTKTPNCPNPFHLERVVSS